MTREPKCDSWVTYPRPNSSARLRLFCFPYAGGGSLVFRKWPDQLAENIEVCSLQLPGREARLNDQPFTQLLPLAETIAEAMMPHLDKPFVLFGHSMGAKISFEVARCLRRKYAVQPVHLFVSGARAPQLPSTEPPTYDLPKAEFVEKLRSLNGTPKEVLEHPELLELLIPRLRADFEVVQTYVYNADAPLECPITVYGGLQDEMSRTQLDAWRQQTRGPFKVRMFPGDHFFIRTCEPLVLQTLSRELYFLRLTG
ncbi:MAG: putative thioesterase [Acidobacteria bacterium]|nr:MAG: putative thioesterase [Acidobacteriota bacterium]